VRRRLRGHTKFVVGAIMTLGWAVLSFADQAEPSQQLTLADLAAYRAALAGKVSASDAGATESPALVSFRHIWSRQDAFRGQRVTVQGRVERIFRQGPVGSFPALAEIWIASPAGDPFCLVVPQENHQGNLSVNDQGSKDLTRSPQIPAPGSAVRFTGTFLKMVRYAAGDGARLAPLIVGDQAPVVAQKTSEANNGGRHSDDASKSWAASSTSWLLGLTMALLAAGLVAWRQFYVPSKRAALTNEYDKNRASLTADPPLEFIEPHDHL
jgi:hypothetical protein